MITHRGGGTRLAWRAGGSLFAVALVGAGAIQIVSLLAHERHHTHNVISAPLRLVDISTGGGSVRIEGTVDTSVTIDASISDGLFSSSHHETVEGDRLVVRSHCPPVFNTFCGVNYTIHMPAGLALKVHSSGGGATVAAVTGDLDVSSSGGSVHVYGGRGVMRLSSSGGGVSAAGIASPVVDANSSGGSVHLTFQQPPASVNVDSSGGGVTVDLPSGPDSYKVDASASGGGVDNAVRTDPASPRVIRARSSGGGIHLDYVTQP